jgi:hypothetical protein
MKQLLLLIALVFSSQAIAVCSSPISRTNFSSLQALGSARLNTEFNTVYARANELPGDCVTAESITTSQILNGTITNADVSASAAIDLTKTKYAVAILSDVKASAALSATSASTTWNIRELNTELDPDSFVTLSANQFTLAAGTYVFETSSVAVAATSNNHKLKIFNATDSLDSLIGTNGLSTSVSNSYASTINGMVTITGTKVFEVRHYTQAGYAFGGYGAAAGIASTSEVYLSLKITRIK